MENLKNECCGCGACAEICPVKAIKMVADSKGFVYPIVDGQLCIHCNKCEDVCATEGKRDSLHSIKEQYGFQHSDVSVLKNCSSGGAFVAISDFILDYSGVVYGAVFDNQNMTVKHMRAENKEQRNKMCGSKYVQSSTEGIFSQVKSDLHSGKQVAFFGTPCQCFHLRNYLKEEKENLLVVDILCHGVPSPLIFSEHIKMWENKTGKKVIDYLFRSKKYGYKYTHEIVFKDGTKNSSIDLRRLIRLYTLNMRESCYNCKYSIPERVGDITIGDLWDKRMKSSFKYDIGNSLVFINTDKGKEIFKHLNDGRNITEKISTVQTLSTLNGGVQKKAEVDSFWKDFFDNGYEYVLDKYAPVTIKSTLYQILLRIIYRIRRMIGL